MDPWGEPSRARHLEPVSGLFRMAISRKHFWIRCWNSSSPAPAGWWRWLRCRGLRSMLPCGPGAGAVRVRFQPGLAM